MKALTWYYTSKAINVLSETAFINTTHIPFIASSTSLLFDPVAMELSTIPDLKEQLQHEERLNQVLKSWKLSKYQTPRDGNCLFHSLIFHLKFQIENGNRAIQDFLQQSCEVDINQEATEDVIAALRQLVVDEWLGEFSEEYQSFFTSGQLKDQAKAFLCSGEFASDIGDLVITALSNIFRIPIIVLTSVQNMPIVIQHPTHSSVLNMDPIFLAYNQYGSGHYYAVVPSTQNDQAVQDQLSCPTQENRSCSCGRKSTKGMPCSFALDQYTCRCPCYNQKQACNKKCKCKNCANPFGCKPEGEKKIVGQKRKREAHEAQSSPLKGKRATTFMRDVGEPVTIGGFSDMEFLVTCSIAAHLLGKESSHWRDIQKLDTSKIHQIYCSIRSMAEVLGIESALFERTQAEVRKLIGKVLFKLEVINQRQQNSS